MTSSYLTSLRKTLFLSRSCSFQLLWITW